MWGLLRRKVPFSDPPVCGWWVWTFFLATEVVAGYLSVLGNLVLGTICFKGCFSCYWKLDNVQCRPKRYLLTGLLFLATGQPPDDYTGAKFDLNHPQTPTPTLWSDFQVSCRIWPVVTLINLAELHKFSRSSCWLFYTTGDLLVLTLS